MKRMEYLRKMIQEPRSMIKGEEIVNRVGSYFAHTLFASMEVMKSDVPRHPNVSKSILKAHKEHTQNQTIFNQS